VTTVIITVAICIAASVLINWRVRVVCYRRGWATGWDEGVKLCRKLYGAERSREVPR
jgi:hypothetical protein